MGTCPGKYQTPEAYQVRCKVVVYYPNSNQMDEKTRIEYEKHRENLLQKQFYAKKDITNKEYHNNYRHAIQVCQEILSIYPIRSMVAELTKHQAILNIHERMVSQFGGIHNKKLRRKVRKYICEMHSKTCGDVCGWMYCDICGANTICEKCKRCICWEKLIYKHNYLAGFHVNMPFFERLSNQYIFKDMYVGWLDEESL